MFWLSFIPKGLIPLTLVLTFYLSNRFVYDQFCACCLHHFSGILLCCLFIVLCFSFRVYSQMSQVTNNLTHPRFQVTDEEEEADIMWNYNHIKDYRSAVKQHTHTHIHNSRHTKMWLRGAPSSVYSTSILYEVVVWLLVHQFPIPHLLIVCLAFWMHLILFCQWIAWVSDASDVCSECKQQRVLCS